MNTREKVQKNSTKLVKKIVVHTLRRDANDTSCLFIYQPKAPAALKNFSKINKE